MITLDEMRPKLLSLDDAQAQLGETEPMRREAFTVGDSIRFEAQPNYNHGITAKDPSDPVAVWVTLNRRNTYQLTREALEETCAVFGFRRDYVRDCPAELLVPHMNYWYREGLINVSRKARDYQFMVNDDQAIALTKQSMIPFSNLALLEAGVTAIRERFAPTIEILVDPKFHHGLKQTSLRLVIPSAWQILEDTGTDGDIWSLGVQIKNSLIGAHPTSIEGYLFRWVCTNGQIDTHAGHGVYTRRKDADEAEVYSWARQAVNDALSGLSGALDSVQALTQLGIEGSLADTLRDVFDHYKISAQQRTKIIAWLEQYDGEITMYVIMNAITQVANDPTLEPAVVESLMRAGGDLPHSGGQRCGTCHRINHTH